MTRILFATENTEKIRSVISAQAGIKLCVLCALCGYNLLFEYEYC